MKRTITFTALLACGLAAASAHAIDPQRGRALYEVRCIQCHDASVHGRQKRVAKNYNDIRGWVARWNKELGGFWGEEEIEDVAAFLNERYYSYPCTGVSC
jgi:mono/diheme cytochrome c family protein